MLEDVLIVSVVFFFIYKTIEVLARRRERLMMVEAFARNPELCRERGGSFRMEILRDVYGVLRPCGFIVGLGIGFLVSWLIMPENEDAYAYGEHAEMVVFALLCICGGLGMGHSLRNGGCVAATGCRQELEMHDRGPERSFP